MLQPSNPSSFVWFWLICSRRGGATAAVVTLEVAVDERKMADGVARSPARLCSREGLSFVIIDACNFLAFALLPSFLFLRPYPGTCVCFSSSCCFVRVICILSRLRTPLVLFVFIFRRSNFLSWRVCCALVPGTSASDWLTLNNSRLRFFFLFQSVTA